MLPNHITCAFIILFTSSGNSLQFTKSTTEDNVLTITNPKGDPIKKLYVLKKVDEALEVRCQVPNDDEDYDLHWDLPLSLKNSRMRSTLIKGNNSILLKLENLQESDSGSYHCKVNRSGSDESLTKTLNLIVKSSTSPCEKMFMCRTMEKKNCIFTRYVCDGYKDCTNGEDESYEVCQKEDPCEGKIKCSSGRCIPRAWCCNLHTDSNCSNSFITDCCPGKDYNSVYMNQQFIQETHFNDMNFIHTAIYTAIGCAMMFMCIVMILVVAICRAHMRRALMSNTHSRRHQQSSLHSTAYQRAFSQDICDLEMYLSRMEASPGVLVAYNINNGVQILSENIEPPPYSEVVSTPPREGPPPPYSSAAPEETESLMPPNSRARITGPSEHPGRGLSRGKVNSEPTLASLR